MKELIDLFKLLQVTRTQPQYGYGASGFKKHELSSLAEHHYLVTMIAWQIARHLKLKGAKIDIEKVVEFCLIHDVGELFGGDISRIYSIANPNARKLAKAFEAENQRYISKYFGADSKHYQALSDEIMNASTDESVIAKIADYMECAHYIKYLNSFKPEDQKILEKALPKYVEQIVDPVSKKELQEFVNMWLAEINSPKTIAGIILGKK